MSVTMQLYFSTVLCLSTYQDYKSCKYTILIISDYCNLRWCSSLQIFFLFNFVKCNRPQNYFMLSYWEDKPNNFQWFGEGGVHQGPYHMKWGDNCGVWTPTCITIEAQKFTCPKVLTFTVFLTMIVNTQSTTPWKCHWK